MTTIYVVRHGTTEANVKKLLQGQIDTPLTDNGKEEAAKLAKSLEGIKFDAIYSSDLGRAFMTEFIIARLDHEENLIHETKELRERKYGIYEDRPKVIMMQEHPTCRSDLDYVIPNGESFNQMRRRVLNFIYSLEHENENILIVTHSACIRAIILELLGKDEILDASIPHLTIHKFVLDGKKVIAYQEIQA